MELMQPNRSPSRRDSIASLYFRIERLNALWPGVGQEHRRNEVAAQRAYIIFGKYVILVFDACRRPSDCSGAP